MNIETCSSAIRNRYC